MHNNAQTTVCVYAVTDVVDYIEQSEDPKEMKSCKTKSDAPPPREQKEVGMKYEESVTTEKEEIARFEMRRNATRM